MQRENVLFHGGDLAETLRAHGASLGGKVDAVPQDQFMNAPEDELVEHVVSSMSVEPLVLYEDRAQMDQRESRIDVSTWPTRNHFGDPGPIYVPAVEVTVMIPYTGDSQLWQLRPNTWGGILPRGHVVSTSAPGGGMFVIEMAQPADEDPAQFKSKLDSELALVRSNLEWQLSQINQFNAGIEAQARAAIQARRARVEKHTGLESLLGIPLKRRGGTPEPIPMRRALVRPLPPVPKSGFKPEPGIADADYDHILSVMRHEGRTFESTPATYAVHDEEELRNIMLAHLNGHYQGDATGETFRNLGKTDIRIEDGNRAAFVAECKVWKGPKELAKAIDQLLGYLTWRDCKTAVVVFNKHNSGFTGILESLPSVFEGHPNFRKSVPTTDAGEWQFVMTSREDDGRLVKVHVLAFNLFAN